MPIVKLKSLIRFIIMAFKADFIACILVYQKLISKYEHNPTPSQPKNNWIKLSAVIKINIKQVNNEINEKKRIKCGSFFKYAIEYIWTSNEILFTIINIIMIKLSKKKVHSTLNNPEVIQFPKFKVKIFVFNE